MLGFEAAALCRGESFAGDLEAGEVEQCLARPAEPLFEPGAERRKGRLIGGIGTHQTEGPREDRGALRLRGHAEGAEQCERLAGAQRVPLRGTLDGLLFFRGQSAQGIGERSPEFTVVELALQGRGEPARDGEAA